MPLLTCRNDRHARCDPAAMERDRLRPARRNTAFAFELLAGASILLTVVATDPLYAQSGFCLLDAAPADGHPIFGNPEFMLNPPADAAGDTLIVPTSAAIGDLDGDGDVDAVSTYAYWQPNMGDATDVSILLNRGDGTFWASGRYDPGDYPSSLAIGDLDGDGLNDLAVTNDTSGRVSVLINAGAAQFPTRVSYPVRARPHSVVIADLNGDGHPDLAVANAESNNVSVLLNNGAGAFGAATNYAVFDIPDGAIIEQDPCAFGGPYLAAGDLDGDGDIDLVVPAYAGVSVLRNHGDGTFAPFVAYAAGGSPWSVAIGDVDGDGDPDLVTANLNTDSVSVLKNQGGGMFPAPEDYDIQYAGPNSPLKKAVFHAAARFGVGGAACSAARIWAVQRAAARCTGPQAAISKLNRGKPHAAQPRGRLRGVPTPNRARLITLKFRPATCIK